MGTSISKISTLSTNKYEEGKDEGPFKSLSSLRKESKIFQQLLKSNPKRAQQICLEKNINEIQATVKTDNDTRLSPEFVEVIEHCIKGKIKKGKITGVHFYDEKSVKIKKVLKRNKMGVFEAVIEYYDSEMNRWLKKEKSSTFFPLTWTYSKLFHECLFALNNKNKKFGTLNLYRSKMKSGIKVEIVIKEGILKSIYPLI